MPRKVQHHFGIKWSYHKPENQYPSNDELIVLHPRVNERAIHNIFMGIGECFILREVIKQKGVVRGINEDLWQVGLMAVNNAIKLWDPTKSQFNTYVGNCVGLNISRESWTSKALDLGMKPNSLAIKHRDRNKNHARIRVTANANRYSDGDLEEDLVDTFAAPTQDPDFKIVIEQVLSRAKLTDRDVALIKDFYFGEDISYHPISKVEPSYRATLRGRLLKKLLLATELKTYASS